MLNDRRFQFVGRNALARAGGLAFAKIVGTVVIGVPAAFCGFQCETGPAQAALGDTGEQGFRGCG